MHCIFNKFFSLQIQFFHLGANPSKRHLTHPLRIYLLFSIVRFHKILSIYQPSYQINIVRSAKLVHFYNIPSKRHPTIPIHSYLLSLVEEALRVSGAPLFHKAFMVFSNYSIPIISSRFRSSGRSFLCLAAIRDVRSHKRDASDGFLPWSPRSSTRP